MVFTEIIGMNDRENQEDQSQGDHLSEPAANGMAVGLPRSPGRVSLLTPVDEQMPTVNHTSDASTSSIAPTVLNPSFHSNDTDPLSLLSSSSTLLESTDTLPSFPVLSTTMMVTPSHSLQVQSSYQSSSSIQYQVRIQGSRAFAKTAMLDALSFTSYLIRLDNQYGCLLLACSRSSRCLFHPLRVSI